MNQKLKTSNPTTLFPMDGNGRLGDARSLTSRMPRLSTTAWSGKKTSCRRRRSWLYITLYRRAGYRPPRARRAEILELAVQHRRCCIRAIILSLSSDKQEHPEKSSTRITPGTIVVSLSSSPISKIPCPRSNFWTGAIFSLRLYENFTSVIRQEKGLELWRHMRFL